MKFSEAIAKKRGSRLLEYLKQASHRVDQRVFEDMDQALENWIKERKAEGRHPQVPYMQAIAILSSMYVFCLRHIPEALDERRTKGYPADLKRHLSSSFGEIAADAILMFRSHAFESGLAAHTEEEIKSSGILRPKVLELNLLRQLKDILTDRRHKMSKLIDAELLLFGTELLLDASGRINFKGVDSVDAKRISLAFGVALGKLITFWC